MDVDPLTSRTADELLRDHAAFDTDDEDLAERPPLNAERDDKAILSPRKRKAGDLLRDDIVDEEVKITKQRRKIPKLDTDKLISDPGLPKIRNLLRLGQLKKKLRLKGKGHEFPDVARLLNFYQMWLDNLYPRAKFADALQMVEKAGHTKKMQMYRKSWIDEGKPGHVRQDEVDDAFDTHNNLASTTQTEPNITADLNFDQDLDEDPSPMFFGGSDEPTSKNEDGPNDDELEALLAQEDNHQVATTRQPTDVDSEGEDDLDAILAQGNTHDKAASLESGEQSNDSKEPDGINHNSDRENRRNQHQITETNFSQEDKGENETETLLDRIAKPNASDRMEREQPQDEFNEENFLDDDLDDFDALLHNQGTATEPELPRNVPNTVERGVSEALIPGSEEVPELENVVSSSPIPNIHTDELDQLMDEHDATVEQRKREIDPDILEEFMSSSPIQN